MTIKTLAIGATLALAAGAAAIAADEPGQRSGERVVVVTGPGGPHGDMHGEMDANRDGAVTRDEFRALHDKMFGKLDKNGDGKITDEEFAAHRGPGEFHMRMDGPGHPGGHPRMRHPGPGGDEDVRIIRRGPGADGHDDLDANKDGKLSLEEFTSPMREHFQEADKNRNGFLDKEEMEGRDHVFMFRRMERRE